MALDKQLTKDIEDFLNTPEGKRDLQKGALLVLKCTRNQILFANMMRAPQKFESKMVYELRKAQAERLRRQAAEDARAMQKEVLPKVEKILAKEYPQPDITIVDGETLKQYYGKRADHERLPAEVQNLWQRNTEIWHRIKALHEQLKTMDNAADCERYEYLKQMLDLESEHTANFTVYDNAKPLTDEQLAAQEQAKTEDDDADETQSDENDNENLEPDDDKSPAADATKINAARKYISENRKKIASVDDEAKRAALLAKIQERYDFLVSVGAGIDEKVREGLKEIGINVE